MTAFEATEIISFLYRHLLGRTPGKQELQQWAESLVNGTSVRMVMELFSTSTEYQQRSKIVSFFPNGHYYSPIVDPNTDVRRYVEAQSTRVGVEPQHIRIDVARMDQFFRESAAGMASANIAQTKVPEKRFFAQNAGYPLGDALVLRAVIDKIRPRRIVEVGSGFSTACMLDTLDDLGHRAHITCIDPFTERLRSFLRPDDYVEILAMPVQDVPVERFAELEAGDILFIDSTHVVKTGSDVHYELFEVLPRLQAGVLVHFHDIPYPFEYPVEWIFDQNYSWNEAYSVRAFLMYNMTFSVFYSATYMRQHRGWVMAEYPDASPPNPGSHLWLRKES